MTLSKVTSFSVYLICGIYLRTLLFPCPFVGGCWLLVCFSICMELHLTCENLRPNGESSRPQLVYFGAITPVRWTKYVGFFFAKKAYLNSIQHFWEHEDPKGKVRVTTWPIMGKNALLETWFYSKGSSENFCLLYRLTSIVFNISENLRFRG